MAMQPQVQDEQIGKVAYQPQTLGSETAKIDQTEPQIKQHSQHFIRQTQIRIFFIQVSPRQHVIVPIGHFLD